MYSSLVVSKLVATGRTPVTAAILAGGESSRMSAPKALLKVGGSPIIKREAEALGRVFDELLVVANDPAPYAALGLAVIPDADEFRELKGPMTGLYSALLSAGNDYVFAAACDMPFIEPELVEWMAGLRHGFDAVVPKTGGLVEPLFGVYARRAAPVLEGLLRGGNRRLQDALGSLAVRFVGEEEMRRYDPELRSLMNVNTPDELSRARSLAALMSREKRADRV